MRSQHHLHFRMLVEVWDNEILIRLPRTSDKQRERTAGERLHDRQVGVVLKDVGHTVETRVAGNNHIVNSYPSEQRARLLVLHKKHVVAAKHAAECRSIPFEERLGGTENG